MDTNEHIRQLEAALSKEYDDLQSAKRALEIQQLTYDNKLKQLSSILNKNEKKNPVTEVFFDTALCDYNIEKNLEPVNDVPYK